MQAMRPAMEGCELHSRWRREAGLAGWLAMGIVLLAIPSAARGQTYRDRAPPPAQRWDGLPERIATRPDSAGQGRGAEIPPARQGVDASNGQQLVAQAARRVYELPGLEAKLRMKIASTKGHLLAVGDYQQLGSGEEKLLRLNLRAPIGSKIGTIQEIRGRDYLWIIRNLPPDEPQLERVGMRQARIAIRRAEEAQWMTPLQGWMLLGGLSQLLTSLDANFDFGPPRSAMLGDVPVLIVRGKWKLAAQARLTEGKKGVELPAQLPHEVELTLGEPGPEYPLFPYRIEYLRNEAEDGELPLGRGQTLALIELFEVRQGGAIDRSQFEFDPEDREVDDITMAYLRSLGLVPSK